MEIIPIGGHDYTIGRLNALDQLHVSRKIAPIIPNIMPTFSLSWLINIAVVLDLFIAPASFLNA